MNINQLLKFQPILKEKIWGGERLMTLLNKKSDKKNIGESWEISDVEGAVSIVSKGAFKGQSLKELIATHKENLVGKKIYEKFGNKFPLLIKFIDAKEVLSIQLHPNDTLAKKRHNSFGKTEMWYVMEADEDSNLIIGFQKDTTPKEYLHHLKNKTLTKILNTEKVKNGDVYFIPTGRIHAIGAGVLLAEIQQTSDITYRIYDWNRKDSAGNYRKLHTEEAIDSIDYKAQKSYKTEYEKKENQSSEIISYPYFTTHILVINKGMLLPITHFTKDSFVLYMCVKGSVFVRYNKHLEPLILGQTLLVPACIKEIEIEATENSELLEIYIK